MLNLDMIQNLDFVELKEYLLSHPNDLNTILDETGGTCLHYAAWGNYLELADLLVRDLADNVSRQDKDGGTPLHYAAYGAVKVTKLLIGADTDINCQDSEGNTPMHFAVFKKQYEIVKILLEAGAKYDVKAGDGDTALDLANKENDTHIIELFREYG
jgi:ankyrin repeat protein